MTRPTPLPGSVPTSSGSPLLDKLNNRKAPGSIEDVSTLERQKPSIRADFKRELEARLTGWLGQPESERYSTLKPLVGPYLKQDKGQDESPEIDIDKLPLKAQQDLEKLQGAAEGLEAIFVKKLLGEMRSVSFDSEKPGPMGDFAKDMIDQTVAEQSAKGRSSIGIARMVFLDSAQTMVRSAIARPHQED